MTARERIEALKAKKAAAKKPAKPIVSKTPEKQKATGKNAVIEKKPAKAVKAPPPKASAEPPPKPLSATEQNEVREAVKKAAAKAAGKRNGATPPVEAPKAAAKPSEPAKPKVDKSAPRTPEVLPPEVGSVVNVTKHEAQKMIDAAKVARKAPTPEPMDTILIAKQVNGIEYKVGFSKSGQLIVECPKPFCIVSTTDVTIIPWRNEE